MHFDADEREQINSAGDGFSQARGGGDSSLHTATDRSPKADVCSTSAWKRLSRSESVMVWFMWMAKISEDIAGRAGVSGLLLCMDKTS